MNRATILNKVYTMQADTVANAYAALAAENERLRKLQEKTAQEAYSWRELYQMLKARWEAAAKEGGAK